MRRLITLVNIGIAGIIIVLAISFFYKGALPPKNQILPELYNEPIQTETTRGDFSFEYRGNKLNVKPVADYELWGMVVTQNNINTWYNVYHDKDSVNIKDICVIWGDNIKHESYLAMKFKSGEWTCYPKYKHPINRELVQYYKHNKLSNNHLFSNDFEVLEKIKEINIGDQIYLRGMLADYAANNNKYYRKTSISRDDVNNTSRSGGACEVIFVEEMKIFKKGTPTWHNAYELSKKILLILLIGRIILFFIEISRGLKLGRAK